MEITYKVTNSENPDFIKLTKLLDEDLNERYGELQNQYSKHNKLTYINDLIIVYKDDVPVGCGAFKEHDKTSVELKRIFVLKDERGQGIAKKIVAKLEELALNKNYKCAVLETGVKQKEAISLYKKCGYSIIPNYEPYEGNANSICMKKSLVVL